MNSLQQNTLNFNNRLCFNFEGGRLSSDSGLLVVRSFAEKIGLRSLLNEYFSESKGKKHTPASIIEQLIYTTIAGYSSDDASDDLRHDPIFQSILDKNHLASQPTLSRWLNHADEKTIEKLNEMMKRLFEKNNPTRTTHNLVLDLDSTLFETFGKQQESAYNTHYHASGYHPLMLFHGLSGELLKMELRKGSDYSCKNIDLFLEPVFEWLRQEYPNIKILLRADSGFATGAIYNLCTKYAIDFVIRLKSNAILQVHAQDIVNQWMELYGSHFETCAVLYEELYYQAQTWEQSHRVICRVERGQGELLPKVTFIVTTLQTEPKKVVRVYQKRGNMENFIKEAKIDFSMDVVPHHRFMANAIKSLIRGLAYNVILMMKKLVVPKQQKTSRLISLRADWIKIACKAVTSCRKTIFKLCSSSPHQRIFYQMMATINQLSFP